MKRFFRFESENKEKVMLNILISRNIVRFAMWIEFFCFFFSNIYASKDEFGWFFMFFVFYNDTIIMKKEISDTKSIPECMAKLWHKQLHSFFKVLVIMLWNDEVTRLNLLTLFFFLMQKLSFKIQYHFHQIERKIN